MLKIVWVDKKRFIGHRIKILLMKDEITLLQEENKRLNTIIYVLTEKLQQTETALNAHEKNKVGINNVFDGIQKNMIGINETLYAYQKNKISINEAIDAITKNMIGINERIYVDDKNMIGTNDVINGFSENKVGINNVNIGMLTGALKAVMNKCAASALANTAKTLMHLYASPKCSQKDLMKVTKLSLDGVSKHIKALKNRNLVVKVGFQQYILSDVALKMLQAASK